MDFTTATFQQLLQIAYHEDCPRDYKYKAAFELHERTKKERSRLISRYKRKAAFSDKNYLLGVKGV